MKVASAKINITTATCTATCPSCGLLCDDVVVENNNNKIKVLKNGCAKSISFFEQPFNDTSPQINGKPATLQQAIAHAAKLLKTSQQPLFAGLSSDVQGFRAVYNLAQKTNGSLQHINAASMARNIKVLQSTGWQTTTLTEVKNRADVIVCFGDIVTHNPRFFERFVDIDGMFINAKQREIIFIGENLIASSKNSSNAATSSLLACRADDLPEITLVLRALLAGKKLKVSEVAGVKVSDLQLVADKLKNAKYAVLAWVAKDLDFPHAELTIQNITETVAILNQSASNHSGRAAGLPLGGSDGDTSANNANTWLSGLALNDEAIEHDLMVWVNSFGSENFPFETDKPLIVIGNAAPLPRYRAPSPANGRGLLTIDAAQALSPSPVCGRGVGERGEATKTPIIFIPIATPGLDCSGTLFRVDSAVILPLKKIRENDLPTLTEVLSGIEALL